MSIPVYDKEGKLVENEEIPEKFNIPPHYNSMFDHIRYVRNSLRRGTASTKRRAEVSGGGRKPWRQKGTGRARQGSIRSPIWKGGGVVFGPKPRSFKISVPDKVKKLSIKSSISQKLIDEKLIIVKDVIFEKPSTKNALEFLRNLNINTPTLVVYSNENGEVQKSFRNIVKVTPLFYQFINSYEILKHDYLLITKEAYLKIKEVWGND
ncbi:MAG TPA: 50S ribosomal protein L4 [Caldisericia bacterium]|nr:50S ribosomal protein L4 [Caldisericia bacterium]HPC56514.1 50S ribosomal protein L4 [Caldisericia bacterium]HPP43321.1 50S ribosomal protein L4 [Caldisericia bacterium]HRT37087.1 50S ribosomal protein L4 [Caldisericia bacterium]